MSTIAAAALALEAALKTVPGGRVHTDLGAIVDPPAFIVGPPALTWQSYGSGPTSARFLIYVVVDADERALERLWDLVPQVATALETVAGATVTQANPGRWPAGGVDLPSYELTTEVGL